MAARATGRTVREYLESTTPAEQALWRDYFNRHPSNGIEILLTHIAVLLSNGAATHDDFSPWLLWQDPKPKHEGSADKLGSLETQALEMIVDKSKSIRHND